jgi:hypothetical protein
LKSRWKNLQLKPAGFATQTLQTAKGGSLSRLIEKPHGPHAAVSAAARSTTRNSVELARTYNNPVRCGRDTRAPGQRANWPAMTLPKLANHGGINFISL